MHNNVQLQQKLLKNICLLFKLESARQFQEFSWAAEISEYFIFQKTSSWHFWFLIFRLTFIRSNGKRGLGKRCFSLGSAIMSGREGTVLMLHWLFTVGWYFSCLGAEVALVFCFKINCQYVYRDSTSIGNPQRGHVSGLGNELRIQFLPIILQTQSAPPFSPFMQRTLYCECFPLHCINWNQMSLLEQTHRVGLFN